MYIEINIFYIRIPYCTYFYNHYLSLTIYLSIYLLQNIYINKYICNLHCIYVTIPQLFKDASLCSLYSFNWQRPSWLKHSEQNCSCYVTTLKSWHMHPLAVLYVYTVCTHTLRKLLYAQCEWYTVLWLVDHLTGNAKGAEGQWHLNSQS